MPPEKENWFVKNYGTAFNFLEELSDYGHWDKTIIDRTQRLKALKQRTRVNVEQTKKTIDQHSIWLFEAKRQGRVEDVLRIADDVQKWLKDFKWDVDKACIQGLEQKLKTANEDLVQQRTEAKNELETFKQTAGRRVGGLEQKAQEEAKSKTQEIEELKRKSDIDGRPGYCGCWSRAVANGTVN
ncbi:hypothetical protein M409DRAFT_28518 [Zasmidium cellare ATCC 36951]|uniref:Uncharacterized protein n=1 Tax=Zasmidium cellare ATCC 36951 TaxID=1080233 RepID=A0A6A6C618_ZASCE|nr:uncharacterized protein M409DRAFT_28518 [Zasmidium cellare ATCC 36951]KAF2161189.1 hypothetical protein M409DRAFT_28518 [Zasmidium cellare ATCC 36951]